MYSKAEMQKLKREFWVAFAAKYPRKWILYDTKIKDFSLKFHVENKKVQVLISIEHTNKETRLAYFDKLMSLKSILEEECVKSLVYEQDHFLENGKAISRVSITREGIGVSNRAQWDEIFDFFYANMNALENFFMEYGDYIRDI